MKRDRVLACSLVVVALVTMAVSVSKSQDKDKLTITVSGAAMASDQVADWGKHFMELNPDIRGSDGSSAGKGFEDLIEGRTNLCLASRSMLSEEQQKVSAKGLKLTSRLVGNAGLCVITSPQNPVRELTVEELRKIFLGEDSNWKEVGGPDSPIRCLTRRIPESGGAVFSIRKFLASSPSDPKRCSQKLGLRFVKACGSASDLPIGIAPFTSVKENAKLLALKKDGNSAAVVPSQDTLRDKTYPLLVPITMYWETPLKNKEIEVFVTFCASSGLL